MPHTLHQPLSAGFDRALILASDLHRDQARKGTQIPYVSHVLGVCALILDYGGTETQAIAGLLHDAVEDCGGAPMLARIRELSGPAVAEIVESCTDSFESGPKRPYQERKQSYIDHLRTCLPEALLVVAADKLYNLASIHRDLQQLGPELFGRFNAGYDQQVWYYHSVIGILEDRLKNPIVSTLRAVFEDVQKLMAKCQL